LESVHPIPFTSTNVERGEARISASVGRGVAAVGVLVAVAVSAVIGRPPLGDQH
jgi:hypothetical protein